MYNLFYIRGSLCSYILLQILPRTIQYRRICSLDKNIPSITEKINWTQYFLDRVLNQINIINNITKNKRSRINLLQLSKRA